MLSARGPASSAPVSTPSLSTCTPSRGVGEWARSLLTRVPEPVSWITVIDVAIIIVDVHTISGLCTSSNLVVRASCSSRHLTRQSRHLTRPSCSQSTSTMMFFTHVSQVISASLCRALRCAPSGTCSSAPAARLTSPRVCTVTLVCQTVPAIGYAPSFLCLATLPAVGYALLPAESLFFSLILRLALSILFP